MKIYNAYTEIWVTHSTEWKVEAVSHKNELSLMFDDEKLMLKEYHDHPIAVVAFKIEKDIVIPINNEEGENASMWYEICTDTIYTIVSGEELEKLKQLLKEKGLEEVLDPEI